MSRLLTDDEITRQLADLPGWSRDGGTLRASYDAPDFLAGIRLVHEVALLAEAMDHHPDIDIRWRTVSFALSTHSEGGLTQLDVELAHGIAQEAGRVGRTGRVIEPCRSPRIAPMRSHKRLDSRGESREGHSPEPDGPTAARLPQRHLLRGW